jgi:hypothetical protein
LLVELRGERTSNLLPVLYRMILICPVWLYLLVVADEIGGIEIAAITLSTACMWGSIRQNYTVSPNEYA